MASIFDSDLSYNKTLMTIHSDTVAVQGFFKREKKKNTHILSHPVININVLTSTCIFHD